MSGPSIVTFDVPYLAGQPAAATDGDGGPKDVRVQLVQHCFPSQPCSYRYEGVAGALDLRRPSLSAITLPQPEVLLLRNTTNNAATCAAAASSQQGVCFRWHLNDPEASGFHIRFPSNKSDAKQAEIKKPKHAPVGDVVHSTIIARNALDLLCPAGREAGGDSGAPRPAAAAVLPASRSLVSACCSLTFVVFSVTASSAAAAAGAPQPPTSVVSEQILALSLNRRCTAHVLSLLTAVAANDTARTPLSVLPSTGARGAASPFTPAMAAPLQTASLQCVYEPIAVMGMNGGDLIVLSLSQEKYLLRLNSSNATSGGSTAGVPSTQAVPGSAVATVAELQSSAAQCILRSELLLRATAATDGQPPASSGSGASLESTAVFAAGFENGQVLVFAVSAEKGSLLRVLDAIGTSPVMSIAVLGMLDVFGCVRTSTSSSSSNTTDAAAPSIPFLLYPSASTPPVDAALVMFPPTPAALTAADRMSPLREGTVAAVACKGGQVVFVTTDGFTEIGSIGGEGGPSPTSPPQQQQPFTFGELYHLTWLHSQASANEWVLACVGVDDKVTILGVREEPVAAASGGAGSPVPHMPDGSPRRSPRPASALAASAAAASVIPRRLLLATVLHRFDQHRSWTCHATELRLGQPAWATAPAPLPPSSPLPAASAQPSGVSALVCCAYDRTWSVWLQQPPPPPAAATGGLPHEQPSAATPACGGDDRSGHSSGGLATSQSRSLTRRSSIAFGGRTPQGLRPVKSSVGGEQPPAFSRSLAVLDEPLAIVGDTCGPDDMVLRCTTLQETNRSDGRQLLVTMTHKCRLAAWVPEWIVAKAAE